MLYKIFVSDYNFPLQTQSISLYLESSLCSSKQGFQGKRRCLEVAHHWYTAIFLQHYLVCFLTTPRDLTFQNYAPVVISFLSCL